MNPEHGPVSRVHHTFIEMEALLQFGIPMNLPEVVRRKLEAGEGVHVGSVANWSEPTSRMRAIHANSHRMTF